MKALVFQNKVIEIKETDFPVSPEMKWVDVDDKVEVGFLYDGQDFTNPKQNLEITWQTIRAQRNQILLRSDWTQIGDSPLKDNKAWLDYRQSLRDITETFNSPTDVVWPEAPNA